jgi:hypothetical protein
MNSFYLLFIFHDKTLYLTKAFSDRMALKCTI